MCRPLQLAPGTNAGVSRPTTPILAKIDPQLAIVAQPDARFSCDHGLGYESMGLPSQFAEEPSTRGEYVSLFGNECRGILRVTTERLTLPMNSSDAESAH